MNWAYLHLVLNHVPIVGFPFALVLFAAGAALRKPDVERAGLVAFIAVGLVGYAAFLTGESAEEVAETIPGVLEAAIESHEETAEWAYALGLGTAVLAAVALGRAGQMALVRGGVGVLALTTCILMGATGKTGGEIRHTEFTKGGLQTAPEEAPYEEHHDE
jgi:uncharacterized membrane protein